MQKPARTAKVPEGQSKQLVALLQKSSKSRACESKQLLTLLQQSSRSPASDLKQLLIVVQNLFILEAWRSGMNTDDIRGILKIQNNRVTAVTKHVAQGKPPTSDK